MAPWCLSSFRVCLLLGVLYGVTAQDTVAAPSELPQPPVPPAPQPSAPPPDSNHPTNNSESGMAADTPTNGSESTGGDTTPHIDVPITETTVVHNTTINILSIMSERDSLHDESDRLRVAVIILGVFFGLAAIAIIAGLAWFFITRRKSGTLTSENAAQKGATAERKEQTQLQNLKKTPQTKSENQNVKSQQPGSSTKTSGEYEYQSNSTPKSQPKPPPVPVIKGNTGFYANTPNDPPESMDNIDLDEREVYIEVDEDKANSKTSKLSPGKIPKRPNISGQQNSPDEVYENYTPIPEAGGNYSELDTESQYEHHYD